MSAPTPRRRGRTRWLQLTSVSFLAVVVTGVVVLEAIGPEVDPGDLAVDGVPPLALEDARPCTRQADDGVSEEIRDAFVPGGRISSTQVHLCPQAFDGLQVTYVGEVIGEVLPRRGGAWAQVNDDRYALEVGPLIGHQERAGFNTGLSVWLPDGLHERVQGTGRAAQRGDVVLVQGTLVRADPDDGGGITVRAEELTTLAPMTRIEEPLHVVQAVVAALLAVLAVAAVAWSRRVRQR
jgi:hypothetical protein